MAAAIHLSQQHSCSFDHLVPRLLSFIVAIYLIIVGLIGLNAIHHFIR